MFDVSEMKMSEIQRYVNMSKPGISKHFKGLSGGVTTNVNNRIVGISPDATSDFISKHATFKFKHPSITLSANLCGGVGKTSSVYNLSSALRRVIPQSNPIVLIDGDSQASFTRIVCGSAAKDNESTLIDYFEKKASVSEILHDLGNNGHCVLGWRNNNSSVRTLV